ncbi:rhombosortase [Solimonas terrae]|nr:rhombosortase [Solimonas terrae]
MITNSIRQARDVWTWPLLLMLTLLIAEWFGDAGRSALAFDHALIADGQWWRLITCSYVHLGWYHLMLNEIGLFVLVLLCPQPLPGRIWLLRLFVVSLGMGLCLFFFVPDLSRYVGMSGVIHGLFVLGLLPQALKRDWIAIACLVYLLGKLGYEIITGAPVSDAKAIGGHVVTEAHLYGAIIAFVYGLAFGTFTGREIPLPAAASTTENN